MKRLEITINGEAFPCQQTAGAMLRFKELTDREVSEIDPRSISDLIKFLWCCIAGACKREGKEFSYSLMDFADAIGTDELNSWQQMMSGEETEEAKTEKKRKYRSKKS